MSELSINVAKDGEQLAADGLRLSNEATRNPVIERALERLRKTQERDRHMSHHTKHSSHAVKHGSTW
jgi:hypothetical protein